MQLLQLYGVTCGSDCCLQGFRKELTMIYDVSLSNKTKNHSKSRNAFKSQERSRTFNPLSGFTCVWFSHQKSELLLKKISQNHIITAVPKKYCTRIKSFYRDSCNNILYLQKTLNVKLCYSIYPIFTFLYFILASVLPFVVEVN